MSCEWERVYPRFDYDFENSGNQDYRVPDGYCYIRRDRLSRLKSAVIYGLAVVFGGLYCRLFLHLRIRGKEKLKAVGGQGFVLFGNHTQPVGDVFTPALLALPRRIYTVVSPANLALPGIGRILPYLGALPTPDTVAGMRVFTGAVRTRLEEGHPVVIYPEAHVWKYCNFVRPFTPTSFKLAVNMGKPVFAFTVTYQKRRCGRKPAMTVHMDGPFELGEGSPRQQAAALQAAVEATMKQRCTQHSHCAYIRYVPAK